MECLHRARPARQGWSEAPYLKIATNLMIALAIFLPSVIIFTHFVEPRHRGFFCDDNSLRYPYFVSTISSRSLYLFGLFVNIFIIACVEALLLYDIRDCDVKRAWLINCLGYICALLFSSSYIYVLTDLLKFSVGRLRPHFFDVCRPHIGSVDGTVYCIDHPTEYVTNYTCAGNSHLFRDESTRDHRIKEVHLSFPSGHSSFACQSMAFVVFYLQCRLVWNRSQKASTTFRVSLQQPVLYFVGLVQFAAILVAVYVCISRVFDNKHHPTDVIGGSILGLGLQYFNCVYVANFFDGQDHNCPRLKSNESQPSEEREV